MQGQGMLSYFKKIGKVFLVSGFKWMKNITNLEYISPSIQQKNITQKSSSEFIISISKPFKNIPFLNRLNENLK